MATIYYYNQRIHPKIQPICLRYLVVETDLLFESLSGARPFRSPFQYLFTVCSADPDASWKFVGFSAVWNCRMIFEVYYIYIHIIYVLYTYYIALLTCMIHLTCSEWYTKTCYPFLNDTNLPFSDSTNQCNCLPIGFLSNMQTEMDIFAQL